MINKIVRHKPFGNSDERKAKQISKQQAKIKESENKLDINMDIIDIGQVEKST